MDRASAPSCQIFTSAKHLLVVQIHYQRPNRVNRSRKVLEMALIQPFSCFLLLSPQQSSAYGFSSGYCHACFEQPPALERERKWLVRWPALRSDRAGCGQPQDRSQLQGGPSTHAKLSFVDRRGHPRLPGRRGR